MDPRPPRRTSEPDFRALFESAPGLYLVLRPDLTIIAASDAYLSATMTQREQILGRGIFEVFPDNPDDPGATGVSNLRASLMRVLRDRRPDTMAVQKYDVRRPAAEGGGFEERHWSPMNSPVLDDGGDVIGIIHRVEDVTAFVRLKQQEHAQQRESQDLRQRAERMEAEIYRRAQDLQTANEALRRSEERLQQLNETLEQRVIERTAQLEAANHQLQTEIEERWSTQLQLRASETRHREVVELIREAIWIHNDGRVVFANPQAAEMFGIERPEALIGRPVSDLIHPDDRERAAARTRMLVDERKAVPLTEMRLIRPDGDVVFAEIQAVPFRHEGKPSVLAVARNVTQRKQTEEQLRQAQKMESVGQLTGGVAHDFNNLLTVIIGGLDLAVGRAPDDVKPLITSALQAAERGAGLIRQLLAFSRRQALNPESLDFNDLAAGMDDLLRRALGDDIEIEMKFNPEPWLALADRGQVESALLNLTINARDAMPAGGKMTIETGNVRLDEDYAARNTEVAQGDYVMLAVTDTGSGMPPDVVARAFEPFFTTKGIGKGTGLGLSMIYGFAKQSGGHLKIYSEVGHGTAVRLYLPRLVAEPVAAAVPKPGHSDHPRGGEAVLVVEDDPLVRNLVTQQLRELGYRVMEAADGPSAQQILAGDVEIDLLLTDVVMPGGLTGRQLAESALQRRPKLKTLYASGYTENSIIHQGKLDPGVHFLPKPFRRQELALKVREALDA